jgi:membrane protein CcdC involved in cytochrome C biogenesis
VTFKVSENAIVMRIFATALLVAVAFCILVFLLPDFTVVLAVVSTVVLLCSVIFVVIYSKTEKITVNKEYIFFKKGVVFTLEYYYPNKILIYPLVIKPPVHACFGLYIVILKGVGSTLLLPPLEKEAVEKLLKSVASSEE